MNRGAVVVCLSACPTIPPNSPIPGSTGSTYGSSSGSSNQPSADHGSSTDGSVYGGIVLRPTARYATPPQSYSNVIVLILHAITTHCEQCNPVTNTAWSLELRHCLDLPLYTPGTTPIPYSAKEEGEVVWLVGAA